MPERIQLSRERGFNLQVASQAINGLEAVNVARPGRWGNDHVVWRDGGQWLVTSRGRAHRNVDSKAEGSMLAVKLYAEEARKSFPFYGTASLLLELRGKNLACWCKPGEPCHADVLLELANAPASEIRP